MREDIDREVDVEDRRSSTRLGAEEPGERDQPRAEAAASAPEGSADQEAPAVEVPPEVLDVLVPATVDDAAQAAIGHFTRLAWENMGLVPGVRSKEIREDLAEARRAVDAVDFLARMLEGRLTGVQKRELDNIVSDLKINVVRIEAKRR